MVKLVWDQSGQRRVEYGVDRGVFYGADQVGTAWNGLVSVNESFSTATTSPRYESGIKRGLSILPSEYSGTIEAFTYPDVLDEYVGFDPYYDGMNINEQLSQSFGLSYRTRVSDDLDGDHYKIHIVYNVFAIPSDRSYSTINTSPKATSFSWDLTALPVIIPDARPTSHIVIDSRLTPPRTLLEIENYLYGTAGTAPRLPSISKLLDIYGDYSDLTIERLINGRYTAEGVTVKFISPDRITINHKNVIDLGNGYFSAESE